ncbi:hypothetical protein NSA42_17585 [Paeniclostridium sordellii]|uniref:hypothetical protein n=1 Tax=Paraclostridium sordellii TaxID=1505 RepID=UPI00214A39B7|nr:hypothetical protein [Paeniclostridium sordellii]MCR1851089.1 hypothetical protein [Paeniclostridium sordellii]
MEDITPNGSIKKDKNGNYILSPESMKNLIELIDMLDKENTQSPEPTIKGLVKKKDFCCAIKPLYTDEIIAKRSFREYYYEIASVKCDIWASNTHRGTRHHCERTHCDNIPDDDFQ